MYTRESKLHQWIALCLLKPGYCIVFSIKASHDSSNSQIEHVLNAGLLQITPISEAVHVISFHLSLNNHHLSF